MSSIAQFLPLPSLLRLLRRTPPDARYRKRARSRVIFSAMIEPLRWYERLRYDRTLRKTKIEQPPIFLLGFGRSGTTHLHNLMWLDPNFGGVSNYQANMQSIALTGRNWLPGLLASRMPSKRPMDNVAISMEGPQEEEIALANASEHAALHFMSFPRELPGIYDRYVCDLGSDSASTKAWKEAYLEVLKKASILSNGRRLVLKTPPNTGRVGVLLEMFPDARFVHIVRNPYRVYQSMRNMYRKILPSQVLQSFDWADIDAWIIDAYRLLMSRYLEERKLIPPENLVEIRFEDLDEFPIKSLRNIYEGLRIGAFNTIQPLAEQYLTELGTYEKNQFTFPPDVVRSVNENWGFAFEAFGYEREEPS
ncbi:MAG: sulfotransferase [Myxococcota bacterium]